MEDCTKIAAEIYSILKATAFALIGAILAYQVAIKAGRYLLIRKSLHDIADIFAKEAAIWSERSFSFLDKDIEFHNASIDRLSPHIHYLRNNHKQVGQSIWPDWVAFHGENASNRIKRETYDLHPERGKDYWIERLYRIADALRDC